MTKITIVLMFLLLGAFSLLATIMLHPLQSTNNLPSFMQVLTPKDNPLSVLYMSPASLTPSASGSGTIDIAVDTKENTIGTAQLEIGFDQNALLVTGISAGDFFSKPHVLLNEVNNTTGRISYAVTSSKEKSGSGILASIHFWVRYPVSSRATKFMFYPKTSLMHLGETRSLIATSSGAEIQLPFPINTYQEATPSSNFSTSSAAPQL